MEEKKFCQYCGSPIDSEAKFCTKCGKSINSEQNASVQKKVYQQTKCYVLHRLCVLSCVTDILKINY